MQKGSGYLRWSPIFRPSGSAAVAGWERQKDEDSRRGRLRRRGNPEQGAGDGVTKTLRGRAPGTVEPQARRCRSGAERSPLPRDPTQPRAPRPRGLHCAGRCSTWGGSTDVVGGAEGGAGGALGRCVVGGTTEGPPRDGLGGDTGRERRRCSK